MVEEVRQKIKIKKINKLLGYLVMTVLHHQNKLYLRKLFARIISENFSCNFFYSFLKKKKKMLLLRLLSIIFRYSLFLVLFLAHYFLLFIISCGIPYSLFFKFIIFGIPLFYYLLLEFIIFS